MCSKYEAMRNQPVRPNTGRCPTLETHEADSVSYLGRVLYACPVPDTPNSNKGGCNYVDSSALISHIKHGLSRDTSRHLDKGVYLSLEC